MSNVLWQEAATFIQNEKEKIDDATIHIREGIRKARRNYEQKYDKPIDRATGKKKIFMPLTTENVDAVAPRFEMDPEAIVIKTNEPLQRRKALIWEELLKAQFKKMEWEQRMKAHLRPFTNEGNMVIEMFWDTELKGPNFRGYDVKDIWIFPKEFSMHESSSFAVKKRMLKSDFMNNDNYDDEQSSLVHGSEIVRDDYRRQGFQKEEVGLDEFRTELEWVEIYERHGFFPKKLLTGEDTGEVIEGVISVAWVDRAPIVVEVTDKSRKDMFMEAWYNRRDYTWYGNGLGIMLRDYQRYYNKIVNRRSNNEDVLHHGMFVKRRGMNIDARQRTMSAGIFIEADDPAGLVQLKTNDITGPSYTGEDNILTNVQRLTGVTDLARGLGATRSASEAAIKDRNTGTRFSDPQESLNRLFRLAVNKAMDLDRKFLSGKQVIKITGRDEDLIVFDDFKKDLINKTRAEDGLPPIDDAEFRKVMAEFGGERFITIHGTGLLKGDFEADIDIDSSLIKSKAGLAEFIINSMQIGGQIPGVAEELDFSDMFEQFMSLNNFKVKRREKPVAQGALPGQSPQGANIEQALGEDQIKQALVQEGAPRAEQAIAA